MDTTYLQRTEQHLIAEIDRILRRRVEIVESSGGNLAYTAGSNEEFKTLIDQLKEWDELLQDKMTLLEELRGLKGSLGRGSGRR